VGAGAHGRGGFYRYYVCRTRQAKGPGACRAERVPADDLEKAVSAALVAIYSDYDFIKQAAAEAHAAAANELPRLASELAATEAQLRETTAAIDRYLRAFEAGTMAETVCGPRVAELYERRSELIRCHQELVRREEVSTSSPSWGSDLFTL
jgi:site-specific DNA recombinase